MFQIVTENTCDMEMSWLKEHQVGLLYLSTIIGEDVYNADHPLDNKEFYRMLAAGAKPSTSQVNPEEATEYFENHISEADEFLYIGFASGLSGTVGSVRVAVEELREKYPEKRIEVIDTQCASAGEALMVYHAVRLRDEGKTLDETADWIRKYAPHVVHAVTVDSLHDLWRGGRVSRSSAVVGDLVGIKPIIYVDDAGKLVVAEKIRGRKKALNTLVDYMDALAGEYRDLNETLVTITHGDVPEDAEDVKEQIRERFGLNHFMITNAGPIIGAHTGPTLVIVSFFGKERHR
jgi:DegV family protein with EDD domain